MMAIFLAILAFLLALIVSVVAWLLACRIAYLERIIEINRGVLKIPEDYE